MYGEYTARIYSISRESCDTYTSTPDNRDNVIPRPPECSLGIAARVILGEPKLPERAPATRQIECQGLRTVTLSTRGAVSCSMGA
jgi:hypothetical protein